MTYIKECGRMFQLRAIAVVKTLRIPWVTILQSKANIKHNCTIFVVPHLDYLYIH
jgi:hypothetical protein